MIINNRKDLDNAPSEVKEKFINALAHTINKWQWDGEDWTLVQNITEIERFGFELSDFSNPPVMEKPDKPTSEIVNSAPNSITKRQLIIGLATDNWITWPEAEEWANNSKLPNAVNNVIDKMTETEKYVARITVKTMSVVKRNDPLLINAAKISQPNMTNDEIIELIAEAFTRWGQL